MPIYLNLARLSGENKVYLDTYKNSAKIEIDVMAQLLIDVDPVPTPERTLRQQQFKTNIQNESFWNLEGVSGSGNRLSSFTSIKLERAVESPKVFKENFFDEMDSRLKTTKKLLDNAIKTERKIEPQTQVQKDKISEYEAQREKITVARLYNQFLQVQAQAVVAEVGSLHYFDRFQQQLEDAYLGDKNSPEYNKLLENISDIQLFVKQYSLNTLQNETIDKYSATNTMEIRKQVSDLCKEIQSSIDKIDKEGNLKGAIGSNDPLNNLKKLRVVLEVAEDFFRIKNDINCQNPTEIAMLAQTREKVTSFFQKIALATGVLSISSGVTAFALPVSAPITGPASAVLGGVSTITALSALALKSTNSVINLAQYGVAPTTDEAAGVAMAGFTVALGGIGQIGPLLAATNKITNLAMTSSDVYSEIQEFSNSGFKQRQEELIKSKAINEANNSAAVNSPSSPDLGVSPDTEAPDSLTP